MKPIIRRAVTLLALGLAGQAHAVAVTFTDPTVNPAGYMTSIYSTDPTVNIAVSATAAGNPGAALQVHFTNSGGAVNLNSFEAFINSAFTYNPGSQGAIHRIDFSSDRFVDFGPVLNPSLTISSRPLVAQNGKLYFATFLDPQVRGAFYTSASGPIASADFSLFDFGTGATDATQHPDFTAGGAAIGFGFASRFNLGTGGAPFALDGEFRFDNLTIRINGVPEPSELALMCAGLTALGASAARRKRNRSKAAKRCEGL